MSETRLADAATSAKKPLQAPIQRRSFFKYAGATAGVAALALAGCKKDDPTVETSNTVSFGSGEPSALNYVYALEQLEAAFYQAVKDALASTTPPSFSTAEVAYLNQIAAHEAIHRDFLKAYININAAGKLLQNLNFDFSSINFSSRTEILTAAVQFEDLGVAAYNGAGQLLKTPIVNNQKYLVVLSQIASVEARHAAYMRDLVSAGTFSDTADVQGLDQAKTPAVVIAAAQKYIKETLDATTIGQ